MIRILILATFVACASSSGSVATPIASASATSTKEENLPPAPLPVTLEPSASAEPTPPPPPPAPPPPKMVLHLGDSMVGGYGGLTKALETKFKALGSKFVRDWETSVSILTFDHEHKLQDLLTKHSPDLVILTLGANDVFVPYPNSLASSVRSIAHKMSAGGRACYWMAPPIWKKDTGIVDVIKKNAEPCKVFDASYLKLSRAGDGVHPTDRGGADWADAFMAYFQGTGSATPNEPAAP